MSRARQELARLGEEAAAAHLQGLGWRLLARNYRCPLGELDLVALDGAVLVFVEVRARSSCRWGAPEESVNAGKQRRVRRMASVYLQHEWKGSLPECRFDVVAVWGQAGRLRVELFRDAF